MIPYPRIDPVFLKVGPLSFRWYGLMYALSFILSYFLIPVMAARKRVKITNQDISDLLFYVALGIILGGRMGYILFYNPVFYLTNPLKVFAVWEGGMSFHGGLLGGTFAGILFCLRRKRSFYELADISVPGVSIGLGLGRIGNFINGELFGRPTDLPWCMIFPEGGNICRHPSQLYQATLEGGVIFLILWWLAKKDLAHGSLFWSLIFFYGLFRFSVEFVREPDAHIGLFLGFFSMGQLLSLPMLLIGLGMILFLNLRKSKRKG